jgi:hypothetical protein
MSKRNEAQGRTGPSRHGDSVKRQWRRSCTAFQIWSCPSRRIRPSRTVRPPQSVCDLIDMRYTQKPSSMLINRGEQVLMDTFSLSSPRWALLFCHAIPVSAQNNKDVQTPRNQQPQTQKDLSLEILPIHQIAITRRLSLALVDLACNLIVPSCKFSLAHVLLSTCVGFFVKNVIPLHVIRSRTARYVLCNISPMRRGYAMG